MRTIASLNEPLASKELGDGVYEVWVTAEARYDDVPSELLVVDSFVRPADIRLKDTRIDPAWLPKRTRWLNMSARVKLNHQDHSRAAAGSPKNARWNSRRSRWS